MYQLALPTVLLLLLGFYGLTFLMSTRIGQKKENVDSYMVSNNSVGFGMSAASMTATWIWAASFYAAASAGYKYGLSGALHYGFWGALMILFIYPFGKRFRQLAPKAHTLGEIMHARHGRSSQMILAGSNIPRQLHQPHSQLHRRRRTGRNPLAAELRAWRAFRGLRRAVIHTVVGLPLFGADRLRPVDGDDPRGSHHHSDDLLPAGRTRAVRGGHATPGARAGKLLFAHSNS